METLDAWPTACGAFEEVSRPDIREIVERKNSKTFLPYFCLSLASHAVVKNGAIQGNRADSGLAP